MSGSVHGWRRWHRIFRFNKLILYAVTYSKSRVIMYISAMRWRIWTRDVCILFIHGILFLNPSIVDSTIS